MANDEDNSTESSPPPPQKHLVFAYYITGHGFGHATRAVEVVRHLIAAGHDVYVVTGAPDCGAVQADALSVDPLASLEKVSDVVPIACRAADDAGIRSACVTNFR
ncbi:hypothetical protein C5167_041341 [Papaver somniferum]|uniref:L-arabinokinase n=1 Tax=Papaver somniferum TaxID=3469 RepID=A0A4Y7IJT9_PAPSO|nr:hypothetical protein C5167_041341 [Papaver somniferum]